MYFLQDDTAPNDLLYEVVNQATGAIGYSVDSHYHGDYPVDVPIRVSPDGAWILLGTGTIWDAATLQVVDALPGPVDDAAWIGDELLTLRAPTGRAERSWSGLRATRPRATWSRAIRFGSWSGTADTPS